jgi:cathepsin D
VAECAGPIRPARNELLLCSVSFPFWASFLLQSTYPSLSRWTGNSPDAVVEEGGQFTLGGRNTTLYDGDITFIPILDNVWWTVPFKSIIVSENSTINLSGEYGSAVVDTGTTLMLGPDEVVDAVYQSIPNTIRANRLSSQLEGFWALRKYSMLPERELLN